MNHLGRKSKFAVSTNVDIYISENYRQIGISLKSLPSFFRNCENPYLLLIAMRFHSVFLNPYCGHFTNISSSYHIRHNQNHPLNGWFAQRLEGAITG